MPAPLAVAFPCGHGKSETHGVTLSDGRPNTHPTAGTPYATITAAQIEQMLASPPEVRDKMTQAPWFIPTDYAAHDARTHESQRQHGRFHWLTLDIDDGNPPLDVLDAALVAILGDVRRLIYSTSSATPELPRWRALIPLETWLSGEDFTDAQTAFFDALVVRGINPDRTLAGPGQLVFLPCRTGDFYQHELRPGQGLLTLSAQHPLAIEAARIRASRIEAAQMAEQRRAAREATGAAGGGIIGKFNSIRNITAMLTACGYTRHRESDDWRSPLQESGSYATQNRGDHWVSLSGSDASAGVGVPTKNGHRTGDAFDLFCHFKHGGDEKAAIREAAKVVRDETPLAEQFPTPPGDYRPPGMTDTPPQAAPPARLSRFFPASDLAAETAPPRPWHVPEIVPGDTVTLFGGDGGTGKSLVALQLAVATALGRPWLGQTVRAGRALYLSAEDDRDELHRRLSAICAADFTRLADLGNLTMRSLAGEDALLAHLSQKGTLVQTELFRELDTTLAETRPALVVLDTLADLFPGNENDRAQARQFVGILRGLAIRHGAAVMLLAHPSKSGMGPGGDGTSGSTAWNNSVRSRLYLSRVVQEGHEPNPDARRLSVAKANYGRTGLEIGVQWRAGVFEPLPGETSIDRMATGAKAEAVFLKLLCQRAMQGLRLNASSGPNFAPKVFAGLPGSEGISKRAFKTAMEGLLASGKIQNVQSGPPSKIVNHLVESEK